ncbi:poly(A) polymerase [Streptomyces sp. NRRL S-87]|uniref:poly(A) polymerase n=1 Tax=Streptomyces sp. NRRL S-87 TaxID=1463920 RepID=UPI0004C0B4A7|nr:poly(A) polymerase [Streptomyces sp. NRRL S-87]
MRTSEEIYHQVRWDPRFDPARFVLGLLQRGAPPKRVPLPSFVPGGDIPWHRVLFVEADGELVWDRASGLDVVGRSAAGRVREPRRLRAPFFTARTPYAWREGRWQPVPEAGPAGSDRGAAAAGAATAAGSAARVRLLTWNTLWDRYDADRIDTARRRPRLLAALAAADADVIALQEVEPALVELLSAAPWVREGYVLGADPAGRDAADSGLLLLSRLPVREAGVHALGPHKAVSAVVVDTAAGYPLTVAATHLSSDHSAGATDRRTAELARIAEGLAGVDGEIALLGDFNDGRSSPEGPAAVLGMRDAWEEAYGPGDSTPTFDPAVNPLAAVSSLTGRASRLDRILVRGAAAVAGAALLGDAPGPDGLFVSDHYGVRADLRYAPAGAQDGPAGPDGADVLDAAPSVRTALAWLPPAELLPAVDGLRESYDPQVRRWPAHVNLLFGFAPEHEFERAAALVGEVAARTEPFPVRVAGVYTFGHREDATVWLDPAADGDGPWQHLRAALAERFPACRGRADGFTPHLTLGRTREPHRVAAVCEQRLAGAPTAALVGELALLSRRGEEPMRVRALVELGTGAVTWLPELPESPAPAVRAEQSRPDAALDAGPDEDGVARDVSARVAEALGEGVVRTVGSRAMGCALPGADLDLVAVLPGTPDPAEAEARIAAAFPEAGALRRVVGARVPGLRFSVGTLGVDLVVVGAGALDPAVATRRRSELGEAAAVALSAVSDAEAVRSAVAGREPEFTRLARRVKAWAGARGLDSGPFGGLPGLAWTVLAAHTVATAATPTTARTGAGDEALLRDFFATWAAWDWHEPVALDAGAGPSVPAAVGAPGGAALTVLTPSAPVRSCTAQVSPGFRDLVTQELYRAWELLEADPRGWTDVTAPPPLHRRHAAWAVVTVRAHGSAGFEESMGRVRGRLRALLGALEEAGAPDAHAWPRPLRPGALRARLVIGLGRTPPDAERLAGLARAWGRDLDGVDVTRVEGGSLPTLA